ncbi:hypothetical protein B0H12DRAFT_1114398 [Mycena haematopus]|nr:hypothetical protein B0H12DRAFT_1114398 [Mycena haematopus]
MGQRLPEHSATATVRTVPHGTGKYRDWLDVSSPTSLTVESNWKLTFRRAIKLTEAKMPSIPSDCHPFGWRKDGELRFWSEMDFVVLTRQCKRVYAVQDGAMHGLVNLNSMGNKGQFDTHTRRPVNIMLWLRCGVRPQVSHGSVRENVKYQG